VPAAGCADAAAIESAADELIQIAAVFDIVTQREVITSVQLVIEFRDAVIVVLGFQDVEIFWSDAQSCFGGID
jgi:hypothetical protein